MIPENSTRKYESKINPELIPTNAPQYRAKGEHLRFLFLGLIEGKNEDIKPINPAAITGPSATWTLRKYVSNAPLTTSIISKTKKG